MPKSSCKPRLSGRRFDTSIFDEIGKCLDDAPPIEDKVTLYDGLLRVKESIRGYLDKGYNVEAIADVLKERGVPVSPVTLRAYIRTMFGAKRKNGARRVKHGSSVAHPKEVADRELDADTIDGVGDAPTATSDPPKDQAGALAFDTSRVVSTDGDVIACKMPNVVNYDGIDVALSGVNVGADYAPIIDNPNVTSRDGGEVTGKEPVVANRESAEISSSGSDVFFDDGDNIEVFDTGPAIDAKPVEVDSESHECTVRHIFPGLGELAKENERLQADMKRRGHSPDC